MAYYLLRSDYADMLESPNVSIEDFNGSAASSSAILRAGQDEVTVSAALEDDSQ